MGSPALLEGQAGQVLSRLNDITTYLSNHVVGGIVADGGTTQGSGAGTAPNFDVDTTAIVQATVDGVAGHSLAAQTDADATAGDAINWGATSGKAAVAAVVLTTGSGNDTPAIETVWGSVAASGSAVAPTDAAITTALGHNNWVRLADCLVTRTGDTTITIACDNRVRPGLNITNELAETEAAYRDQG